MVAPSWRRQTGLRRQLLAWLRERGRLAQNLHLLECQRMEAELPAMLQVSSLFFLGGKKTKRRSLHALG